MNIEEAKAKVKHIEEIKGDDEAAHGMEDQLREEFIRHIAEQWNGELAEIAKVILSTEDIDFARWCA